MGWTQKGVGTAARVYFLRDEKRMMTLPNWKVVCWEKDICIGNTSDEGEMD